MLITALVLLCGAAFKGWQLSRDPRNPALRAMCGVLIGLAISQVLAISSVFAAVDELLGVANLCWHFTQASAIVALTWLQVFVVHLVGHTSIPQAVRWRWLVTGLALVAMTVVFLHGPFDREDPDAFFQTYAHLPETRIYIGMFCLMLAYTMIDVFRLAVRYAPRTEQPMLRLSLRLFGISSVGALIYIAHRVVALVLARTDAGRSYPERFLSYALTLPVLASLLAAFTAPSLGPMLVDLWHWPRRLRWYRDLEPLWSALTLNNDTIQLTSSPRLPGPRLVFAALYSRIIEIYDGLSDLPAEWSQHDQRAARALARRYGFDADHDEMVAEAAKLAITLQRTTTAPSPNGTGTVTAWRNAQIVEEAIGEDIPAAASRLARISRTFAALHAGT